MSGSRTCLALMVLFLPISPAAALPASDTNPTMVFAACTGRLSALMEHQWIVDPPASERTQEQRARMIDLLEATMRPADGRAALNRRVEAKTAQALLLTRSRNGSHPRDAAQAGRLSERALSACLSLLLS